MTQSSPGIARPLDWQETLTDRGDGSKDLTGWEAETYFGTWYSVEQYFGSDSYAWHVKHEFDVVADCDDPDQAKEAAQADFEKRVRAAVQRAQSSADIGEVCEETRDCGVADAFEEADFATLYREVNESGTTTLQEITNVPQIFCQEIARQLRGVAQAPTGQDTVTVPRAALEWLFGAAPDHEGMWFGESVEQTTRKYGFRSRFRKMCESLGYPISSTDRQPKEATAAQHFGLAKGEPARFVRNGVLETCQCRDCSALTSPEKTNAKHS